MSKSSAKNSQSLHNEIHNNKEYISDSEISIISDKNRSEDEEDKSSTQAEKSDIKAKLKYIKKTAFIGCRFKENIAQNRSEALLMFNLASSLSLQANNIMLVWLYKHTIDEFSVIGSKDKSGFSQKSTANSPTKARSISDMNERTSESLLLTEENLIKMEKIQQKSKYQKHSMTEADNLKLINKVLADNLCFEICMKNMFIGNQRWLMDNSNEPIVAIPFIELTKIDLDSLKLSVLESNERQPLYTSDTSYFCDILLWNKHKFHTEENRLTPSKESQRLKLH